MRAASNKAKKLARATIRRMAPPDVEAALAILKETPQASPWPEESLMDLSAKGEAWVAEEDSLIAGLLLGRVVADEFQILNLAVGRAFRRHGIATQLMLAALGQARKEGVRRAYLEVRASNKAALAVYEQIGFRVSGRRQQYYRDPGEDAVLMDLSDLGSIC